MITDVNEADGSLVEWAGFLNGEPVFALADGRILFPDRPAKQLTAHDGLLCSQVAPDLNGLVCGGEDGKVSKIEHSGDHTLVGEAGNRWVDHVAISHTKTLAWASGRTVWVQTPKGGTQEINLERTAEGLAFAPKGSRLAIARFDGVELHWIATQSSTQFLEWKGAHTGVFFSPDGKSVISMMQENALHGWRLSDGRHMKMTGYPTKVKSWSWSKKGRWLATSGAQAAILWPFAGKDGPMGKSPMELGSMGHNLVTQVSCHPTEEVVAIGYDNGMIMLSKFEDGQLVRLRDEGGGEISAMSWHPSGNKLAFGSVEGTAGIIDLAG